MNPTPTRSFAPRMRFEASAAVAEIRKSRREGAMPRVYHRMWLHKSREFRIDKQADVIAMGKKREKPNPPFMVKHGRSGSRRGVVPTPFGLGSRRPELLHSSTRPGDRPLPDIGMRILPDSPRPTMAPA